MQNSPWPTNQLISYLSDSLRDCLTDNTAFALITLINKVGPSPRHEGSQMLVREDGSFLGEISGGCVEANLAAMAVTAIQEDQPTSLTLGDGGKYVDIQLPCGSSIDIAIDPFSVNHPARQDMLDHIKSRREWTFHGPGWIWTLTPPPQLIIYGKDTVALALAGAAHSAGFQTILSGGAGMPAPDGLAIGYFEGTGSELSAAYPLDRWTAVVSTMHDIRVDAEFLAPALLSDAFFVGVLGSKQHIAERESLLADKGIAGADIDRLSAPVGLDIGAATPQGIAVSILAEIFQRLAE